VACPNGGSFLFKMRARGIKNGELLRLVSAEFDVFITSDKNLKHQQNLSALELSVILLPSNQVPIVKALLPQIDDALTNIGLHDFVEI
jgi:hypothetical protein